MKFIKLSKTSWLILTAGVFLVVLAGLGVARSQQLKEQADLNEQLSVTENRMEKTDNSQLMQQVQELQEQVDEEKTMLSDAKERLDQTVISADVTEQLFSIAQYSGVVISNMNTTTISEGPVGSVDLSMISLNVGVTGEVDNIVDFVINLNNGFKTGFVKSVQITIPSSDESEPSASVQMAVYSYEGQ